MSPRPDDRYLDRAVGADRSAFRWNDTPGAVGPSSMRARTRTFQRHIALWTLQGWLAMFFAGAAYAKLTQPEDLLVALLGWPEHATLAVVRIIGVAEALVAAGMLAPLMSWRIGGPALAASAKVIAGGAILMTALHLARGDLLFAGLNLVLVGMALAVLVGRMKTFGFGRRR